MKKIQQIIIFFILFLILPIFAFATPTSVDRQNGFIQPLIKTDYFQVDHITASSTQATSTFPNLYTGGNTNNIFGSYATYQGQASIGAYPASNTPPTTVFQVPEIDWLNA